MTQGTTLRFLLQTHTKTGSVVKVTGQCYMRKMKVIPKPHTQDDSEDENEDKDNIELS